MTVDRLLYRGKSSEALWRSSDSAKTTTVAIPRVPFCGVSEECGGPDRDAAAPDHLAALLAPTANGSRGFYRPGTFDLHLRGARTV